MLKFNRLAKTLKFSSFLVESKISHLNMLCK